MSEPLPVLDVFRGQSVKTVMWCLLWTDSFHYSLSLLSLSFPSITHCLSASLHLSLSFPHPPTSPHTHLDTHSKVLRHKQIVAGDPRASWDAEINDTQWHMITKVNVYICVYAVWEWSLPKMQHFFLTCMTYFGQITKLVGTVITFIDIKTIDVKI